MDLNYFRQQIEEEIAGAEDYKSKAEECPEFAEMFSKMSEQEMGHAKNLMMILKKQTDEADELYKHFKEKING